jgi:hypothetical protein
MQFPMATVKKNALYMGNAIKMQLRRPESTQNDFRKDTIQGHVSLLI